MITGTHGDRLRISRYTSFNNSRRLHTRDVESSLPPIPSITNLSWQPAARNRQEPRTRTKISFAFRHDASCLDPNSWLDDLCVCHFNASFRRAKGVAQSSGDGCGYVLIVGYQTSAWCQRQSRM